MKRLFLPLLLAIPLLVSASIVENNSGLDRTTPGNWTFSAGTARDNIVANGDTWVAQNAGHFAKSPYGATDGTTGAEGFVGIYKTNSTDSIFMSYTFTATTAITEQEWIAKGTIWRNNAANSGRLHFSVNARNEGFVDVDTTGWFGQALNSPDYDMGTTAGTSVIDGPTATFTTDLSSFNIQNGNSVVYRFTLRASDALASTQGRQVGIGVQLVPEPNTVLMGLAGSFLLYIMYRRKN